MVLPNYGHRSITSVIPMQRHSDYVYWAASKVSCHLCTAGTNLKPSIPQDSIARFFPLAIRECLLNRTDEISFGAKCLSFKPFRCSHPTQPFFTELSTTQPTTRSSTVTTTVITTTPPSSTTPGKAVESRLVLHLLFLCFIPILNTQVSHTQSFISSLTET